MWKTASDGSMEVVRMTEAIVTEEATTEVSEEIIDGEQTGETQSQEQESDEESTEEVVDELPAPVADDDGFLFDSSKYVDYSETQLEDVKKLEKQVFYKESFIQKQAKEVGDRRATEVELNQKINRLNELKKEEETAKEDYEDPTAYRNNIGEQSLIEQQIAELDLKQKSSQTESILRELHPDIDDLVKNEAPVLIREIMTAHNQPEAAINAVISDMQNGEWKNADDVERAQIIAVLDKCKNNKEVKNLKQQIEDAKNGTLKAADNVADNIKKLSSNRPVSSGGSFNTTKSFTHEEVGILSDEELDAQLESRIK